MTLRLNGSTSGYVEIDAPATAGSNNITLPSGNGSANQFLKNGSTAGTLGWSSMVETATGVGMGISTPDAPLTIKETGDVQITLKNSSGTTKAYIGTNGAFGTGSTDDLRIRSEGSNIIFGLSGTERMRINSAGEVLVGATSVAFGPRFGISADGVTYSTIQAINNTNTGASSVQMIRFAWNGSSVGRIESTSSATSYLSGSDYRLKDNIQPMTGALEKIAALKPCTFEWKIDGKAGQGFIAHELQEVVADCVSGEKDAVDADGNPEYQGVDQSKLVPLLTAALQEAIAKIESQDAAIAALEARIAALEVTP